MNEKKLIEEVLKELKKWDKDDSGFWYFYPEQKERAFGYLAEKVASMIQKTRSECKKEKLDCKECSKISREFDETFWKERWQAEERQRIREELSKCPTYYHGCGGSCWEQNDVLKILNNTSK